MRNKRIEDLPVLQHFKICCNFLNDIAAITSANVGNKKAPVLVP